MNKGINNVIYGPNTQHPLIIENSEQSYLKFYLM